jgi:hypothetical protein
MHFFGGPHHFRCPQCGHQWGKGIRKGPAVGLQGPRWVVRGSLPAPAPPQRRGPLQPAGRLCPARYGSPSQVMASLAIQLSEGAGPADKGQHFPLPALKEAMPSTACPMDLVCPLHCVLCNSV